jgi:hypothetical protein
MALLGGGGRVHNRFLKRFVVGSSAERGVIILVFPVGISNIVLLLKGGIGVVVIIIIVISGMGVFGVVLLVVVGDERTAQRRALVRISHNSWLSS